MHGLRWQNWVLGICGQRCPTMPPGGLLRDSELCMMPPYAVCTPAVTYSSGCCSTGTVALWHCCLRAPSTGGWHWPALESCRSSQKLSARWAVLADLDLHAFDLSARKQQRNFKCRVLKPQSLWWCGIRWFGGRASWQAYEGRLAMLMMLVLSEQSIVVLHTNIHIHCVWRTT